MPFTLAHPAAIIPLARRRDVVFSALVVGSMAPDLGYFIPLPIQHSFGHTLPGVFLFCLPAGLVVLWLFHHLLKRPLLALLPASHQERLMPLAGYFRFGPAQRLAWIVASLLLGSFTHIFWDSFTHEDGWTVQHLSFLQARVLQIGDYPFMLYKLLQYGSSVLGVGVLIYCYMRWLSAAPRRPIPTALQLPATFKLRLILGMGAGAGMLAVISAFCSHAVALWMLADFYTFQYFVRQVVIAGMSTAFMEIVCFSACWHIVAQKHSARL